MSKCEMHGIRAWIYLLILESLLTGCTEQTLGWQFVNSKSRGVPIQEILFQTIHVPGWIHPIYKMASMRLPKMPMFRTPWKERAHCKACTYINQTKCLLWHQSSFLVLHWTGKPGVRNIKLLILPLTPCMTLFAHLPICTMTMHLAWMWQEHAMAYLVSLKYYKILLWEVPDKHTYCHYK